MPEVHTPVVAAQVPEVQAEGHGVHPAAPTPLDQVPVGHAVHTPPDRPNPGLHEPQVPLWHRSHTAAPVHAVHVLVPPKLNTAPLGHALQTTPEEEVAYPVPGMQVRHVPVAAEQVAHLLLAQDAHSFAASLDFLLQVFAGHGTPTLTVVPAGQ
jgi:hypothetical protein